MKRWIYGIPLALVVILMLVYAPPFVVQLVIVGVAMIGMSEFLRLVFPSREGFFFIASILYAGLLTAGLIFLNVNFVLPLVVLTVMSAFISRFSGDDDFDVKLNTAALLVFGFFYTAGLFAVWGLICALPQWHFWIFIMLVCTFASDTGAFLTGHAIGKHKLAPKISPGKSIEGYIGGAVFSVMGAFVVRYLLWPDFSPIVLTLLALMLGLWGPLGDLSESLIKRAVGAKDSGTLIPGHGGLLDRVDAVLFNGPVVYLFALLFSPPL
ncbi:phosphatidate cytidylyltransferase [bacterium]|nr:phosphatidate cytidylyltransferase [bacterium]